MAEQNPMVTLQADLSRFRKATLNAAARDADKLLDLLVQAREQVANASDPHRASLTMTKLQNPVNAGFEAINNDLKEVSKAQKVFGKALDKSFPSRPLSTDYDAMASYPYLINRAVAMHMLREGQFSVASTFLREAHERPPAPTATAHHPSVEPDIHSLQSQELQDKFANMYEILNELKNRNLVPAIAWANLNTDELEARGSNLEFELSKLQFVWLFKGPSVNGLPDDALNGRVGALAYAKQNFRRFQARHSKEIQQLSAAMIYASNITQSPYANIFDTSSAFDDVALSFTREFCSLLGLSAESPLYVAATAGAIALPQLLKYTTYMKAKRTEWTTENELAFETPLPRSMIYHPIFVCPVSKEQTTEQNPPMMLPCGHVICKESLQRLTKGSRFKCPYCPNEGHIKDAREIKL
ncbi:Protein RMD5-like protein A [Colletotrichum chlorophyti]|uniref:GID complex catalytic subunit 2 n=1 Tax=Colletotrichum chlorophyti TaxID=708187 RepID=A0A1Q8RJ17_9PEZI|nr:Protein RMD5-like protein A [Colletotrichum chlorophyti]